MIDIMIDNVAIWLIVVIICNTSLIYLFLNKEKLERKERIIRHCIYLYILKMLLKGQL
jgi:hypothetical protein